MQHEKVIRTVSYGQSLVEGDVMVGRNGAQQIALSGSVDDRVCRYEVSGEGLGGFVNFKLRGKGRVFRQLCSWISDCTICVLPYMVGMGKVNAQLVSKPLGERLESAAQDGQFVS